MTLDPVVRVTDRGSTEFDISVRAQTADGAALLLALLYSSQDDYIMNHTQRRKCAIFANGMLGVVTPIGQPCFERGHWVFLREHAH